MHFARLDDNHYLIRLQKGEEVVSAIKNFAKQKTITNASFSAIGSVESPTLAFYKIGEKQFIEKDHEGFFELISMNGSIALYKEEPLVHSHISISDENMQVFGGHLVKAVVSATVELTLTTYPTSFAKQDDEETGLKLWKLPEQL